MAAAVGIAVAQKLGGELLPLLVDKVRARGALDDDIKVLLPTVEKCTELLSNLPPHQQAALTANINVLQHALTEADGIIKGLLKEEEAAEATAAAAAAAPPAEGLGGKAAAMAAQAKKKVTEAVEAGAELIYGDPDAQHRQLSALNERLLHASLDLSLALSRLPPPKSSACVIS
jgi:hypothetical protein